MSNAGGFLIDVAHCLTTFAKSRGISPDSVFVRFTLADSSTFVAKGLKLTPMSNAQGWMIESALTTTTNALVVRETHIIKAEFDQEPVEKMPIGLHTEARTTGQQKNLG
jgi:hypothetical protein